MSQERPESSETKAALFERWLLEASESELQELIDDAKRLFFEQPLDLLCEWKSQIDARLAAEPETTVFSMSDPHEIRLRQWGVIADRLGAEINYRSRRSVAKTPGDPASNPALRGAAKEHAVAARRMIVRQNADHSDEELCELLDREEVRLPKGWPEAGVETWTQAWQIRRKQIHVIFSKDRKTS